MQISRQKDRKDQGRTRREGGSDPGLRRLAPPQTYPCSCRRSGGRSRRHGNNINNSNKGGHRGID
jgi:hypothetical protein